ncbi:MAG: hypothetical protein II064_03490 [Bacteroidales bacterium]|nr:hypothetical protein [Bacteroidales bacterium]
MRKTLTLLSAMLLLLAGLCACETLPEEPGRLDGTWRLIAPKGMVQEGFTTWTFNSLGDQTSGTIPVLWVRNNDVFAGDRETSYFYSVEEDGRTLHIREASFCGINGSIIYQIQELSSRRLSLKLLGKETLGYDAWTGWPEAPAFERSSN